jgi:hypothetical protein
MMTQKFLLPLLVSLLMVLAFGGDSQAALLNPFDNGTAALGGRLTHGTLIEIADAAFTLQTSGGDTLTYQVDGGTRFRISGIDDPAFADLETGMHLAVAARVIAGERVARLAIVTPDDFDPSQRFGIRVRGIISAIDLDASTLSLRTPSGEELAFEVGERARFIGAAQGLEGLEEGWAAAVAGARDEEGVLHAALVAPLVLPRPVSFAGEVTQVSLETGTFELVTRRGRVVTVQVDQDTAFRSRDGAVEGLEDLQPGMLAAVRGLLQEGGDLLAKRVIAMDKEDLPDFELKAAGRLVAVGLDFLTLRTRQGEDLTFQVAPETRFRGRGFPVRCISDLRVGMVVMVAGETNPEGEALARAVIALKAPGPPRR